MWTGAAPLPVEMTWTNRYQLPPQRHPHPIYLSVRPDPEDSEAFGGCPICREAAQA
ncbi:hypothetical protein NB231_02528 [Nitrococcus mobilis Nb-231]|uniref:Uncharacterized protein n=1 Tax=Nitrococcus mobilis Nb-231 TaxID=314278 RepID=A4BRN5_9GAMM|nr:hypothetical protein NB231_02528 [Nitrococcus mobilis Nb-231]